MSQSAANQSTPSRALNWVTNFSDRQMEHFPLNTFFCLQTFPLYSGLADFIGSVLEYPLALAQM